MWRHLALAKTFTNDNNNNTNDRNFNNTNNLNIPLELINVVLFKGLNKATIIHKRD